MEHERNGYTNCNWYSWYSHQKIGIGIGGLRNNRMSGDYPNYSIVQIGQNTVKGPGDLRRLAVTQTPVKDHQLMLIWKTLKELNNNCLCFKDQTRKCNHFKVDVLIYKVIPPQLSKYYLFTQKQNIVIMKESKDNVNQHWNINRIQHYYSLDKCY